ncbi:hypothetical protein FQA47_004137 [Oryzias melastigma]|uniref:Ig-like domain-containing protein n=1 Tax=Oryzias melastigma TaxID=30732 RepID=A0A834FFT4_ORYME|nr:hypothetical protein FQA47_004137 [Oryzias melastigma]
MYKEDSGVYWCESRGGGASSMVVNISVSERPSTTSTPSTTSDPSTTSAPSSLPHSLSKWLPVVCVGLLVLLVLVLLVGQRVLRKSEEVPGPDVIYSSLR